MKKTLRIILLVVIVGSLLFFGLNLFAQYKVKSIIKDKTVANNLSYKSLELDLWKGDIRFDSVYYRDNKRAIKANFVSAQKIKILDIILGKSIDIRSLWVGNPSIQLLQFSQNNKRSRKGRNKILDKVINVDTLSITGLNLNLKRDAIDRIKLRQYDIYFENLKLEDVDFEKDLPFQFENGIVKGEAFYFDTKKQSIAGSRIEMDKNDLRVFDIVISDNSNSDKLDQDVDLKSKLDLKVKEFLIKDYKIRFKPDKPELYSRKVSLNNINGRLLKAFKSGKQKPADLKLPINFNIDTFLVENVNWKIDKHDKNDTITQTSINSFSAQLYDLSSVTKLESDLPFSYRQIGVKSGKISHELSALQQLETDSLRFEKNTAKIYGIKIRPKLPRQTYRYYIAHEKDLMDITLKKIEIPMYSVDFQKDICFNAPNILADGLNMGVYRDKRAKDDFAKKALYSKMLRELPIKYTIDTLQLKNADIVYEEVQEKNGQTGKVSFTNMRFDVTHLSNEDMDSPNFPETHFSANGYFMRQSPIWVDWKFRINDSQDRFNITGSLRDVSPAGINSFLTPAFNVQAKGKGIDHLYFNFHGDGLTAQGDFKIEYQNLRFDILRKRDGKRSKFLSFAANLVVPKKRTKKDKDVEIPAVERDDTKSFWNYLWRCVSTGLMHTAI